MVLVVDPAPLKHQIETGLGHAAKEVRLCEADALDCRPVFEVLLLEANRHQVIQVRKEVVIEDELSPFTLVVAGLVGGKFLPDIHDAFVDCVALTLLQVLHHEGEDLLVGGDRLHDVVVALEPQRPHQVDETEVSGDRGERDFKKVLAVPLDDNERPVAPVLREDLGNVDPLVVALGELGHDLIRGKVFKRHQHPLRAVDDEVATGVKRVFTVPGSLGVAHVVEVAGGRTHHHRQLPDDGDDRILRLFALDERHVELNRCCIREVAEARLAREELGLRPVRLTDEGLLHLDLAQFNPYGLFTFSTALNISLNNALFVDDFLEVVLEEIIIGI